MIPKETNNRQGNSQTQEQEEIKQQSLPKQEGSQTRQKKTLLKAGEKASIISIVNPVSGKKIKTVAKD